MKTVIELDHLRYIKDRGYRRRVQAQLRRLIAEQPRAMSEMHVLHDGDRCCRCEAWVITYASLLAALQADGERVLGVVL